jgi:hypothetical protein
MGLEIFDEESEERRQAITAKRDDRRDSAAPTVPQHLEQEEEAEGVPFGRVLLRAPLDFRV